MATKGKKTEDELIKLLMAEVGRIPACDHIISVAIIRPLGQNWESVTERKVNPHRVAVTGFDAGLAFWCFRLPPVPPARENHRLHWAKRALARYLDRIGLLAVPVLSQSMCDYRVEFTLTFWRKLWNSFLLSSSSFCSSEAVAIGAIVAGVDSRSPFTSQISYGDRMRHSPTNYGAGALNEQTKLQ